MPKPKRSPRPVQTPTPGGQLQPKLDAWQKRLSKHLTRGQRARGGIPNPKAVESLSTGGYGKAHFTPVDTAQAVVHKGMQALGIVPRERSTLISSTAPKHESGVEGVLAHETAHQLLRSQGVPQFGESVVGKIQLPRGTSLRNFFKVTEQTGRTEKTPTKEQRRRLSKMRQQVRTGQNRRSQRK